MPSLFNQEEAEKRKQALPTFGKKKETPPPLEEVDLPPCVEIREDSKAWCKICDKKIDSRYEHVIILQRLFETPISTLLFSGSRFPFTSPPRSIRRRRRIPRRGLETSCGRACQGRSTKGGKRRGRRRCISTLLARILFVPLQRGIIHRKESSSRGLSRREISLLGLHRRLTLRRGLRRCLTLRRGSLRRRQNRGSTRTSNAATTTNSSSLTASKLSRGRGTGRTRERGPGAKREWRLEGGKIKIVSSRKDVMVYFVRKSCVCREKLQYDTAK